MSTAHLCIQNTFYPPCVCVSPQLIACPFLFFRFNPGLNMATLRQAFNETIERGISNKCVSILFILFRFFFLHAEFMTSKMSIIELPANKLWTIFQCECQHRRDYAISSDRFVRQRRKLKNELWWIENAPTSDRHSVKKIPSGGAGTLRNSSTFTC